MIDTFICGGFSWFAVVLLLLAVSPDFYLQFEQVLNGPSGRIVDLIGTTVLSSIANALVIGITGGNLGKWLLGVKVVDQSGQPIGIKRAFRREVQVLVSGLALGIPLISLFTMMNCYGQLKKNGATNYDAELRAIVLHREAGIPQYVGFTIGVVLLVGLLLLSVGASQVQ